MDLRRLDLNLLVSLDALLAECNVTRAAARLHISQPALSAQLARLRSLLGDPLLIPAENGRGMVATARGLALQAPLGSLLKDLESLVLRPPDFDPASAERSFTIASNDNGTIAAGLPLMARLQAEAGPGIRLAFVYPDAGRIAAQMESGEVDLLIGSERMVPPAMKATRLLTERFIMAQRTGHPRGTQAPTLDEYCALEHILVSTSGGSFHGFMDEHLEHLGRRRRVALSLQQFNLVPTILRETDYVSTLPSRLVMRHADTLDACPLPFEAEGFTLYLAWHPRNHADPALSWLRALISRAVADVADPAETIAAPT